MEGRKYELPSFGDGEPPVQSASPESTPITDEPKLVTPPVGRAAPYETRLTPEINTEAPVDEPKNNPDRPDLEIAPDAVKEVSDNFSASSLEEQVNNLLEHNDPK